MSEPQENLWRFGPESPTELGEHYVQCGWRLAWIMWDMGNGHAHGKNDPGKGYMWVFTTKEEALKHRKKQHAKKSNVRLSMPFKIEGMREVLRVDADNAALAGTK